MNNKIEKKKTLFIIGLPGCGKTTLSKILAKYLNYNFYDIDLIIEEKFGNFEEDLASVKQSCLRMVFANLSAL